jgi:cellobiose phosphorylase
VAFFACSEKPDNYSIRRDKFVGKYRDEHNPLVVERGKSDPFYAGGGYHVAAPEYKIELEPGEEKVLLFALGSYDKMRDERTDIEKALNPDSFEKGMGELKIFWDEFISKFGCETPNEGMDVLLNGWHQYNMRMDLYKKVNFGYTAWGGDAFGYRDRAQKAIAMASVSPEITRFVIDVLVPFQYESGDVPHSYSPMTGAKPNKGNFADVPLWMVYMVHAYIRETGNIELLNQDLPFFEGSKASLYEHVKRTVDWSWNNRGPNGLPIIGGADWNDAINLNGKGETQMVACQFVLACNNIVEMAEILGRPEDAEEYSTRALEMKRIINEKCWDGEWYIRAFDIDGNPVGSHKNVHGKIFLNAQSWAIIAGVAEGERLEKCLASVRKHLFIKCGLKLCTPAYPEYDEKVGPVGSMVEGLKENGAVFNHAHAWGVMATAIAGRGDWAEEYYNAALPYYQDPEISTTEPYTFCQTYASDEHPEYGLGRLHWHSGTIPWTFIASTQYILGIRADFDGLRIDPCIPGKWKGFTVKRMFRGVEYDIEVKNPEGGNRGVKKLTVDGKEIQGNLVPFDKSTKKQKVTVIM